jgi:endonuclease YncB( thermonuclease family)
MAYRRAPLARRLADVLVMLLLFAGMVYAMRDQGIFELAPGNAKVIDGDSLRINGQDIRLHGIDAPEYRQLCRDSQDQDYPCGKRAAEALRKLVRGGEVTCLAIDTDRYGRTVSDCRIGARNINAAMVRDGWAIAYRQHSLAYTAPEREARQAKRGLWAGSFENPSDYRQRIKPRHSDLGAEDNFDE